MLKVFKYIFFYFLLGLADIAFAQTAKNFRTLDHVIASWKDRKEMFATDCKLLFYKETIGGNIIDSAIAVINSKTSFDASSDTSTLEPLTLSRSERNYLIEELQKMKTLKWADKMFPQSKKLSFNELNLLFATTKKNPSLKNCSVVYGFSKPIFIRNKTICLYLDEEQYGINNSQLSFGFYKLNNNNWDNYADVFVHFDNPESEPIVDVKKEETKENKSVKNISTNKSFSQFAKIVFANIQRKNTVTLYQLVPTFEQSQRLNEQIGYIQNQQDDKAQKDAYEIKKMEFQQEINKFFDYLDKQNVDFSKLTYAGFRVLNTQFGGFEGSRKYTNTSIGIYMNYEDRQFLFESLSAFEIDGQVKIGMLVNFKQVRVKQNQLEQ